MVFQKLSEEPFIKNVISYSTASFFGGHHQTFFTRRIKSDSQTTFHHQINS